MSFLDRIRRKKSKMFQGKSGDQKSEANVRERTNEPVRCETCGTDFSSPQDFERHAREDHPDIPAKPKRGE